MHYFLRTFKRVLDLLNGNHDLYSKKEFFFWKIVLLEYFYHWTNCLSLKL